MRWTARIRCILIIYFTHIQWAIAADLEEVMAIEGDIEYGEYLAGSCASCHNPMSRSSTNETDLTDNTPTDVVNTDNSDSTVPIVHGLEKIKIVEGLLAFRSGERSNTTMRGVAENLSNEEIAALAAYLSEVK